MPAFGNLAFGDSRAETYRKAQEHAAAGDFDSPTQVSIGEDAFNIQLRFDEGLLWEVVLVGPEFYRESNLRRLLIDRYGAPYKPPEEPYRRHYSPGIVEDVAETGCQRQSTTWNLADRRITLEHCWRAVEKNFAEKALDEAGALRDRIFDDGPAWSRTRSKYPKHHMYWHYRITFTHLSAVAKMKTRAQREDQAQSRRKTQLFK